MTFDDYCLVIQQSVAEEGYDSFFPSSYIPSGKDASMNVLECDLSTEGEEEVTLSWIDEFKADRIYIAFRMGDRKVFVCDIHGGEIQNSLRITVEPA